MEMVEEQSTRLGADPASNEWCWRKPLFRIVIICTSVARIDCRSRCWCDAGNLNSQHHVIMERATFLLAELPQTFLTHFAQ